MSLDWNIHLNLDDDQEPDPDDAVKTASNFLTFWYLQSQLLQAYSIRRLDSVAASIGSKIDFVLEKMPQKHNCFIVEYL